MCKHFVVSTMIHDTYMMVSLTSRLLCWMVLLGLRLLHHSTSTADALYNKSLILFNLLQFSVPHSIEHEEDMQESTLQPQPAVWTAQWPH